jgi:NarL family two-component system response regulator LiaR
MFSAIKKYRESIGYGLSLALLFFLLRWLELRLLLFAHQYEIYVGAIAILFTALGVWLAAKITKPKIETVIIEKQVLIHSDAPFAVNDTALSQYRISKRELEVLELMAKGKSNQEIAGELYVSLSTIKTHITSLFEKLDVKRRTQAVEMAKKIGVIA